MGTAVIRWTGAVALAVSLAAVPGAGRSEPGATSRAPAWSEKVVYADGGALWMVNPDGSDAVDLTPDWPGTASEPAIAPDGDSVAFTYVHDGHQMIRSIPPAPTRLRDSVLVHRRAASPSWSPTGARMAYVGIAADGTFQVMTMKSDGTAPQQVTHAPAGASPSEPAWSPETDQIAYVRQPADGAGCAVGIDNSWVPFTQVWEVSLDGTTDQPAYPETDHRQSDPDWTPYDTDLAMVDASYTLYHAIDSPWCEGDQVDRIAVLPTDGDPVLVHPGSQPAWTYDGTGLVFVDLGDPSQGPMLTEMQEDGSAAVRLGRDGTQPDDGRVAPHRGVTHVGVGVSRGERRLKVGASVSPPPGLSYATVTLRRWSHGELRLVDRDRVLLLPDGHFVHAFGRPDPGRCRVHVRYPGDAWHRPSHRTVRLDC